MCRRGEIVAEVLRNCGSAEVVISNLDAAQDDMRLAQEHTTTADQQARKQRRCAMTFGPGDIGPIIALLAGVLILIFPRILNYIVAIYLIVVGLLDLGVLRAIQ
jgi:hypothetical protein